MPLAVDIVANEIARAPNKLPQRVEQRAIVHAPYFGSALQHALPRDLAQASLLRAMWAMVAHKLILAIHAIVMLVLVIAPVEGIHLPRLEPLIFLF